MIGRHNEDIRVSLGNLRTGFCPTRKRRAHRDHLSTGEGLRGTIWNWPDAYSINSNWKPSLPHSGGERIATDGQENEATLRIRDQFRAQNVELATEALKTILLRNHAPTRKNALEASEVHSMRAPLSSVSHDISDRCVRAVRQCDANAEEASAHRDFLARHIVNAGESMRLILRQPKKTGAGTVIIDIGRVPKAALFLVARALTAVCHKRFGRNHYIHSVHSTSGWVNEAIFLQFLDRIRVLKSFYSPAPALSAEYNLISVACLE
jgi:hypothetical protein